MKILREWIEREGTEGRLRLFLAIKAKNPKFTQVSLTNYLKGDRIPDYKIALIISFLRLPGFPFFSYRLDIPISQIDSDKALATQDSVIFQFG
jgi:hypothetical protein